MLRLVWRPVENGNAYGGKTTPCVQSALAVRGPHLLRDFREVVGNVFVRGVGGRSPHAPDLGAAGLVAGARSCLGARGSAAHVAVAGEAQDEHVALCMGHLRP